MKIKANYANEPLWVEANIRSKLPKELKYLDELAHNLWWVWNYEATELFAEIDADLWNKTEANPVLLLQSLTYQRLENIAKDVAMMDKINKVYAKFRAYMDEPKRTDIPSVAYFSMEYGLCNILKIYSGGLGVLAGDYIKEASDINVDLTAVGFLYRYGYFTQTLSMDGQQIANYEAQRFDQLPLVQVMDENDVPMVLEVPYNGFTVYAHVWAVNVGRIKLYLLDTDLVANSEWDRSITAQLYGGDNENRLKQEYLLGIGGILLLNRLGIKKEVYHCNEGHAALINAQRLVDYIQNDKLGFQEALEVVRSSALYTCHTPVPAGHDYFEEPLFNKYMSQYPDKLGISWQDFIDMGRANPGSGEKFSMSVFALNTCQEANGVSFLHGEVSKKMFAPVWKGYFAPELHVGYVTNGVHMPTWTSSEWKKFYERNFRENFYKDQSNAKIWEAIYQVSDEDIWETRMQMKNRLVKHIRESFKENWLK
ncbi:alpha-glucan family phosphorylase, partial [Bacteroidales bacterium OttesenSCG-928-J19]|nr:alpha-glucan family phosphorylase [Bacteroidales bacterium OttesenSCG-928-J19]